MKSNAPDQTLIFICDPRKIVVVRKSPIATQRVIARCGVQHRPVELVNDVPGSRACQAQVGEQRIEADIKKAARTTGVSSNREEIWAAQG